ASATGARPLTLMASAWKPAAVVLAPPSMVIGASKLASELLPLPRLNVSLLAPPVNAIGPGIVVAPVAGNDCMFTTLESALAAVEPVNVNDLMPLVAPEKNGVTTALSLPAWMAKLVAVPLRVKVSGVALPSWKPAVVVSSVRSYWPLGVFVVSILS